jgi:serine/threonine protein kinase
VSETPPERFGPYWVFERLGVGGMAVVHRAELRGVAGFRRAVALKRLHAHVAEDRDALKAFVHEARLAGRLDHANIVRIYELGRVAGIFYIAMEFVPGPTLTQLFAQCRSAAGAMPIPVAVAILGQMCEALDHAHNFVDDGKPLNIIHRDVSPSNVLIANSGAVKLIDFGIAKAVGSGIHTRAGMIKGKYAYVAPEYTVGFLDHRADLFGLGVIAHELLTNRPLFDAATDFDTIRNVLEMPIQPPSRWNSQVTRDLDDVVMTALQRKPDLRWQGAGAMRNALANVSREVGIVTDHDIGRWVEWAFTKKPRVEDTGLVRVIDTLSEPSSSKIELTEEQIHELETLAGSSLGSSKPTPMPARPPGPPSAVIDALLGDNTGELVVPAEPRSFRTRRRRRKLWLVLVLLLAALAGAGYAYYDRYGLTLPGGTTTRSARQGEFEVDGLGAIDRDRLRRGLQLGVPDRDLVRPGGKTRDRERTLVVDDRREPVLTDEHVREHLGVKLADLREHAGRPEHVILLLAAAPHAEVVLAVG